MTHSIIIGGDSRYPVDRRRLREALLGALQKENLALPAEISVTVVGERKMKTLNSGYREMHKSTNVLSFCLQETKTDGEGFVFPGDQTMYLGDIVICYPVARSEARIYNMMVDDWIVELALHSLEHLLGRHHG